MHFMLYSFLVECYTNILKEKSTFIGLFELIDSTVRYFAASDHFPAMYLEEVYQSRRRNRSLNKSDKCMVLTSPMFLHSCHSDVTVPGCVTIDVSLLFLVNEVISRRVRSAICSLNLPIHSLRHLPDVPILITYRVTFLLQLRAVQCPVDLVFRVL